jgi:hypothetical protein
MNEQEQPKNWYQRWLHEREEKRIQHKQEEEEKDRLIEKLIMQTGYYREKVIVCKKPLSKEMKQAYVGLGGIVIIIFLIIGFIVEASIHSGDGNKVEAWFLAENDVKNTLNSPSSASFPGYDDSYVSDMGNNRYIVRAYVDADNAFGAKLRQNIYVDLTITGDQTDTVNQITISN